MRQIRMSGLHKEFCTIPFDIVCTTNFDFLLERQYDLTPRYVYPVVDEEQLSINAGNAGTLLLKLHGDLRHPSRLVVTEADYDSFLTSYPLLATYLSNQLITKTAVFIGYSLDDPDFRQIWHIVSERLGRTRRMAYTVAVNARTADIARFERRGVKVINLPGNKDKYGEVLAATFKELREYMRDNVIAVSKVTEEQPLRELLLPAMRRRASASFRSRWNCFRFIGSASFRSSKTLASSRSQLMTWSHPETTSVPSSTL
jgi:UDP-2,3-diacylglucosamine pyrophosphatase LpxH